MKTTLGMIRLHTPCYHGWTKLLSWLGKTKADAEPLSLLDILESNGISDAVWCLRAVTGHDKQKRMFAVWCARQVVGYTNHAIYEEVVSAMEAANGERIEPKYTQIMEDIATSVGIGEAEVAVMYVYSRITARHQSAGQLGALAWYAHENAAALLKVKNAEFNSAAELRRLIETS